MTQPADANNNTDNNPPSTGFVTVEEVLHEFRDRGRSLTLERWAGHVKQALEKYRAANPTPRAAKDAQAVEKAFASAVELIETMLNEGKVAQHRK
jgi:hypothetical protein